MEAFAVEVGVPDILVNNAGIGEVGTFLATTEAEWRVAVLESVEALWELIHELPGVRPQRWLESAAAATSSTSRRRPPTCRGRPGGVHADQQGGRAR